MDFVQPEGKKHMPAVSLVHRAVGIILAFTCLWSSIGSRTAGAQEDPEAKQETTASKPGGKEDGSKAPPGKDEQKEENGKKERKEGPERVAELPKVVVIGRQRDEGVPEVPLDSIGSRDVLDPGQIKATGARDLNDLVQNLPGASTRPYNGGESSAPNFSMRGLPDDGLTEYILVMIDGVPASPLPYGWTAFSFMPITPGRLHALDYHRGAIGVRYSPDTVSGVINFVTEPVPSTTQLGVRSIFGNFNYRSNLWTAGGKVDDVAMVGTYVDRLGDGYRHDGGFDQRDGNFKLRWNTSEKSWLAASVSYMEDEHQAPGGLTQVEFNQNRFQNTRPFNEFKGFRGVLDVVYHHDMSDTGFIEGFVDYSHTYRNLLAQEPTFGAATTLVDWKDDSFFVDLGARGEAEVYILGAKNVLYGGIRLHREWMPSWTLTNLPVGGGPAVRTMDEDYYLNALSLHLDDTVKLADDRVTIQAGARLEWVPRTEGEDDIQGWDFTTRFFRVLPGIGVAWEFVDDWSVFANYFEGFRSPQAWAYGDAANGGVDLDFEIGRNAEAGVRFEELGGFSGSAVGFWVQYDEFVAYFSGTPENVGKIQTVGADFILEWRADKVVPALEGFSAHGALTVQDAEIRSGPDRGNRVPYAWPVKGSWRFRYARSGWDLSLGGIYVGDSYSDTANTKQSSADGQIGKNDAWSLWDARAGRAFDLGKAARFETAVGATNLFDVDWEVHSRGGFFGGGLVAGAPMQYYVMFALDVNL